MVQQQRLAQQEELSAKERLAAAGSLDSMEFFVESVPQNPRRLGEPSRSLTRLKAAPATGIECDGDSCFEAP
jgi:hypothetical protein